MSPSSLYKVEHVDEVGVVDVPALDAHDVHEQVQVAPRAHAPVEHDPERQKRKGACIISISLENVTRFSSGLRYLVTGSVDLLLLPCA